MTPVALRNAAALLAPRNSQFFLEFEATLGIADVVFVRFQPQSISRRASGPASWSSGGDEGG